MHQALGRFAISCNSYNGPIHRVRYFLFSIVYSTGNKNYFLNHRAIRKQFDLIITSSLKNHFHISTGLGKKINSVSCRTTLFIDDY
jgi:hypothetical protein